MSIATEITRIQQAKADIKTAIEAKGVSVPSSALIDTYDYYVSQISAGGSTADTEALKGLIQRDLTSIDIPSGTTSIGENAFYTAFNLSAATIPDTVTSIGKNAFSGCSALTLVNIGSGLTSIGNYAFNGCRNLTSIDIPDSVTSIGNSAFNNCQSLTGIDIPDSVTSIGQLAFVNCSSITSCTIGSGVTSIGGSAFRGCSSLTAITVNATTPPTLSDPSVFDNTNNCPIFVQADSVDTYKSEVYWELYADRIQAIP